MKIKWIVLAILILIVISWISWPIATEYETTLDSSDDTVSVSISQIAVRLNGALLLQDVTLTQREKQISIERIVIWSQPFPLLSLYFNQDKLIKMVEERQLLEVEAFLAKRIFSIDASMIAYKDSTIQFEQGELSLERKWRHFRGDITVPELHLWGMPHGEQDISLRFSKRAGRIQYSGEIASGTVESQLKLFDSPLQIEAGSFDLSQLQLKLLFPDSLDGAVSGTFSVEQSDRDTVQLEGVGSVRVEQFSDNESSIFLSLRNTVGKVGVDSLRFNAIDLDLSLEDSILICDTLFAEGEDLSVEALGAVQLSSGRYSLDVVGHLPEEAKSTVSETVWGGLYPDTVTNGRYFTGNLHGRGKWYSVNVDGEIVRRSVRSFFKNIFN